MDHLSDFSVGDVIKVKANQLKEFKQIAMSNREKKRYRLCLHDSPQNELQDMLICMAAGDYARPHKHENMSETHVLIEGSMAIVLFNDNGDIQDVFVMDREKGYISYRVNAPIYHMTILLSATAIEHETKAGAFAPESNIFPAWAPDGTDINEAMSYVEKIKGLILRKYPEIKKNYKGEMGL